MDWKIWVISGIVILTTELLTGTFVFAAFGLSAMAAGLASGLTDSLTTQIVVFAACSAALIPASQVLRKRIMAASPGAKVKTNIDRLSGQIAVVLVPVDNDHGQGQVNLQGMEYRARSADGRPIEKGARVRVQHVEGVTLVVEVERPTGGGA